MGNDRARQKKLEKQKKKREKVRAQDRAARLAAAGRSRSEAERILLQRVANAPAGDAWASVEWREEAPALVTVVVTRTLPDGALVAAVALVDRTSIGIKNGQLRGPLRARDVDAFIAQLGRINPRGMEKVSDRTARSILHHAVAYARSLGFEPHPDFPASLMGPSDDLEETPLAHPAKPIYVAEPDDDSPAILAKLTAAVGENNFEVHVPEDAFANLTMVLDRYAIGSEADAEGVLAIVATLEGASRAEGAEGVNLRRGGMVASAHVEGGALILLAGSEAMATALRKELEAVLGGKILFDRRELLSGTEVIARMGRASEASDAPEEEDADEEADEGED
jgi:hypothetical protein